MRFLLLLVGVAAGVLGTLAYGMFVATPPAPAPQVVPQAVATHAPMTVALDERFLTAVMQRAVASGAVSAPGVEVPRTQVQAELRNGTILVHAGVEVLGQPTQGTVTLRPELVGGRLKMDVAEADLGQIQLPALDQVLETQINERLQSLLDGIPVTVTSVGTDPARGLVLTCQVDLDRLENAATAQPATAPTTAPPTTAARN